MKIVNLGLKDLERNFDRYDDPCSSCNDKPECATTCRKATDWWTVFAKLFKGGKL